MVKKIAIPHAEYQEITAEIEELEYLKDSGLVFDAILFYLSQSHLSAKDRDNLRECMTILARGGAN